MAIAIAWVILLLAGVQAEEVGARWGTEQREREYYRVVSVPIPKGQVIEAGAFELMPDNRMAIGTRRGDIYFMSGVDDDKPRPRFDKFAEGLDEIFGLAHRKGEKDTLYVTHSAELTRVRDTNGDGRADRFETVSDAWAIVITTNMPLALNLMHRAIFTWLWGSPLPITRARFSADGR